MPPSMPSRMRWEWSPTAVIEIGPGHGAITSILAGRCRRLIAIEIDRALAAELRFRFREQPQVEILERDVLEVDFAALSRQAKPPTWSAICRITSLRRFCCGCSPLERAECSRGRW